MAIEFESNPVASFVGTYNYKVQFDCTGFYGGTPIVVSSDPLAVVISYNTSLNSFTFALKTYFPLSVMGMLLSAVVLAPPIQGGIPFVGPLQNYGLWWSANSIGPVDGQTYLGFTIGAEQNTAGALAKLPDLVMMQLVLNTDYRSRYPDSASTPTSPGPLGG